MKFYTRLSTLLLAASLPLVSFAQAVTTVNTTPLGSTGNVTPAGSTGAAASGISFAGIVSNIIHFFNGSVIPLIYALAVVFFFIGIVRYFFIEGGEEGQTKGRQFVLYGLIGLVVLFSVWGLVNILLNVLTSIGGASTS